MKRVSIVFTVFVLFLVACSSDKNKENLTKLVAEWQGKEIIFPENVLLAKHAKDTIPYTIPNAEFKVLLYVDSTGCAECKLKLDKWRQFGEQLDSISDEKVPFLFFIQSKDPKELSYVLRRNRIDFPIYLDTENQLNKLNRFIKHPMFRCFLLDKDNKVVTVGNPIYNYNIRDLYIAKIKGKAVTLKKETFATTVKLLSPKLVNWGTFSKKETKTHEIVLQNTGNKPLIIRDVDTSCGCIKVEYSRKLVQPNDKVKITLRYEADKEGFFSKKVKIFCNTQEGTPLSLLFKGSAEK